MQRAMKYYGGFTLADSLAWPETERWELIDGVAYALAAPAIDHQEVVSEIITALRVYLKGKTCRAFVSPIDVVFSDADDTDTVVQPDVLVVCDPSKIKDKRIVGAPDVVVEVLSPSTASRDYAEKMFLYQRAGVPEYWIVIPEEKAVLRYVLKNGMYGIKRFEEGEMESVRLQGYALNIGDLFADIEQQDDL
jgi:Uma2 family endonuclease